MPYSIKHEEIPKMVRLAKNILFYALLAVNVLAPPAYCAVFYAYET
jgi:hypothetical protein